MKVEKTMLTCSIPEFLSQSIVIKGILSEWLDATDFIAKLRYTPEYQDGMSEEERMEVKRRAFGEHLDAAITSAFSDHPQLTSKLICALCFIGEKDADQYRIVDLIQPIKDMFADEEMRSFFISFLKSRQAG